MRTQNTTTTLIERLKTNDLNELIHWSSFLKGGDIVIEEEMNENHLS
jgi:hypothetical protein